MQIIKKLLSAVLLLSAATTQAGSPDTLANSAANLSPYQAQQGGIFLGSGFELLIKPDTRLKTSTESWMDSKTNTIVIDRIPSVSGTKYARDYDPAGSIFKVTQDATSRYFKGNGLPSTPMGEFPVQKGTAAYKYYSAAPGGHDPRTGTPGSDYSSAAAIGISAYHLEVQVPRKPVVSAEPQPIDALVVGVALTGTVWHAEIANASSTAWYNPISILPLDRCFGHPYSQQYHLHAYSWKCFPNQGTTGHSPLFGYALDGFGIYGPRGTDGQEVTNSQLDECHGHTEPVMWEGKLQKIYHYHLNREYPYSVGCFRGKVNYTEALGKTTQHDGHGYTKPQICTADTVPLIPKGSFQ
jgi:hypothetical protein